jgi:4-amino-4-deoxy-L-arabinose transferase-like glycosyltransferase
MSKSSRFGGCSRVGIGVACLLMVLFIQLLFVANRESVTWDEANHIYAGYRSWTHADFGLNPEHPPLVKLLATVPLLGMHLRIPELQDRFFKMEAFLGGKDFVFLNNTNAILSRARVAPALLTVLLALLVFLATKEMFGTGPAFLALGLMVFDPNFLGHGALVTTDVGVSCFLFAAAYAFYRYVKAPSLWRIVLVGVAGGLALASKHSGILIFPMLALLALCELIWGKRAAPDAAGNSISFWKRALRLAGAPALACIIAMGLLWASYGFRYAARPQGLAIKPPLTQFVQALPKPVETRVLTGLERWHVLPEAYIYGLADVLRMGASFTSFLFGKVYPHGIWYFFPAVFAIKSTLPFLILLTLAVVAIATRWLTGSREILFLVIPPVMFFAVALTSQTNLGVRHILPVYPFLSVLVAGAAWAFIQKNRRWAYIFSALMVFQVVTSLRVAPAYVAYANELWGGPANVHNLLTDSNSDWAGQLKTVKRYLDRRGVKNCWFAYSGQGPLDYRYYGIPCRPLPAAEASAFGERIIPPSAIDGPVLISAQELSGYRWGPGQLNPYAQFQDLRPSAAIEYGVFVYNGHFEIPVAAARGDILRAYSLLDAKHAEQALRTARKAEQLAPHLVATQITLMNVLSELGRTEEAQSALEKAIVLAKTVEPEFQKETAANLERYLKRLKEGQKK